MAEQNPEFTQEDLARYNELIEKGEETIDSSWEKFYEGVGFKVWRAPKEVCTLPCLLCALNHFDNEIVFQFWTDSVA